jgi:hypothetical protein
MKTTKFTSLALVAALGFLMSLSSCQTNEDASQKDILPSKFRVAVPSSMTTTTSGARIGGRTETDTLKGNAIYLNLATFIAIGDGAALIVEEFIAGIRIYHIDRVLSLSYVSDDDKRTKNLVVSSQVAYEGKTWDYELTITDAESENNGDGGKALQIFWNKSSVIQGIAIIKPYNCDRIKNTNVPDAMFRIDYSEAGENGYDQQMEVSISGLPLGNPLENPYAANTLRMFVGKKGDVVDVYGNSNHPNAVFFSGTKGFDWAFVASSSDSKNIAVSEVGLPPNTLDSHDHQVLLKEYSIKNVFTTEITTVWPGIDQSILNAYLANTAAPGYFNSNGFISGATSPGADWDVLATRLDNLTPYNPSETNSLSLEFK